MKLDERYWEDCDRVLVQIPNIETLRNKKILITGATGMICSTVAELLFRLNDERGFDIQICLAGRQEASCKDRFRSKNEKYKFVYFDAMQKELPDVSVDYIIHGAGYGDPGAIAEDPVGIIRTNVYGTEQLLQLAKKNQARLLFISSGEIYGNFIEKKESYSEDDYGYIDILNQRAVYPGAKRLAETLCISYGNQYDVDTVIARSCHIYGPSIRENDSRASAQFTRNAVAGKDIVMKSAGSQIRSYCYTLDCASALLAILINGENGQAYNIANRNSIVSIRDVAETIAACAGVKVIFVNPSDGERSSYNLMDRSVLDAGKLEQLGWNAVFDLPLGVQRMLDVLRLADE